MRLSRAPLIILLLLAGAALAAWLMTAAPATRPATLTFWMALAGTCVAAVPPVANRIAGFARRIERLSQSTRRRVTMAVWAVATVYLAATAWIHARDLFPRLHDEQSYTLAAHMLARGRLCMPQHPLADFFESFHIFVRPVYSSIYFPGTAIMNVPGVWLGLPSWVMPVVAAGLVVALTYRVTAELVDDMAGLLAALMVVGASRFRVLSTMVMAQIPAALLGLLLIWAWLHWRRDRRARWALLIGVFAGWAAITRPVDAVAFTLPVGLAMLIERLQNSLMRSALALLVGAAPFLALQLIFDLGVTGRPLRTPYVQYLEQNQPGSTFGSVPVTPAPMSATRNATTAPAPLPASALPQKQAYFYWLVQDEQASRRLGWRHWLGERLAQTAANTLPNVFFLTLLPAGFMGLGGRRWVVAAPILLFFGLYLLNPFYLPHYPLPLIAPLAFLAALGVRVILTWLVNTPQGSQVMTTALRWRNMAAASLLVGFVVLCVRSLPELNPPVSSQTSAVADRGVSDEAYALPTVTLAHGPLREAVHAPAVILFRYRPGLSPDDEPVYNSDVPWPDDAPVIHAHDLGARNEELFHYYGSRQPPRRFYLFDRGDNALYDLGSADQALAAEVLKGRLGQPIHTFGPGEPGR